MAHAQIWEASVEDLAQLFDFQSKTLLYVALNSCQTKNTLQCEESEAAEEETPGVCVRGGGETSTWVSALMAATATAMSGDRPRAS